MEKQDLIKYCGVYVQCARFTPKEGSIPEARVKDLEVLTEMVDHMNPKTLAEVNFKTAEAICSAYYLGKETA